MRFAHRVVAIAASLGAALTLAGCPICGAGDLVIVSGSDPVAAGGTLELELRDGDTVIGPGHCGGSWDVDGVVGGNPTLGTIDTCGHYQAPATAPSASVTITAAAYAPGTCADCCPSGSRTIHLR